MISQIIGHIYVVMGVFYIPLFLSLSCTMIMLERNGNFQDYYYHEKDVNNLVNGFCISGLLLSLCSFSRILCSFYDVLDNSFKSCSSLIYFFWVFAYIPNVIGFWFEWLFVLGIIIFPAMGNKFGIFDENTISYRGTGENSTHDIFLIMRAYILSATFFSIVSGVNTYLGLPFQDYCSCFGYRINPDETKHLQCCAGHNYVTDEVRFDNGATIPKGTRYKSCLGMLDLCSCCIYEKNVDSNTNVVENNIQIQENNSVLSFTDIVDFPASVISIDMNEEIEIPPQEPISNTEPIEIPAFSEESENKNENTNRLCVICQIYSPEILLLPCKHCCICQECFETYKKNNKTYQSGGVTCQVGRFTCPVCRNEIKSHTRIFIS